MPFHHRAVPIVLAAVLIDSIGFGVILPVLPRLIITLSQAGLDDAARIGGWMLAAFAAAPFFAGPMLGSLGDSVGRRPVLLLSMAAFAIDYLLMATAPTIGWLFLGRVVAGIAGAVYRPANAVLADVTPPETRGATFGMMGAAFGIGFILGPAIGGLLAGLEPRPPLIAAAALAGLNALWILFLVPETLTPARRRPFRSRDAHVLAAFRPLLNAGNARLLLLAAFVWQLAHTVYPATWAFFGEIALGWDEQMIGCSLAASGICMALVQTFVTGRAIAAWGEERTVMLGMFAGGLAFLCYCFARETWMVFVIIPFAAFQGLTFPSINALLSRLIDPSHQGALQGGMSALNSVALILGPLLLSQSLALGTEHGFRGGNFAVAGLLALAALLLIAWKVVRKRVQQAALRHRR